jgi:hypothetical protein
MSEEMDACPAKINPHGLAHEPSLGDCVRIRRGTREIADDILDRRTASGV